MKQESLEMLLKCCLTTTITNVNNVTKTVGKMR